MNLPNTGLGHSPGGEAGPGTLHGAAHPISRTSSLGFPPLPHPQGPEQSLALRAATQLSSDAQAPAALLLAQVGGLQQLGEGSTLTSV